MLVRYCAWSCSSATSVLLMWAHYANEHTGAMLEFLVLPDDDNSLCVAEPVSYRQRPAPLFDKQQFVEHFRLHQVLSGKKNSLRSVDRFGYPLDTKRAIPFRRTRRRSSVGRNGTRVLRICPTVVLQTSLFVAMERPESDPHGGQTASRDDDRFVRTNPDPVSRRGGDILLGVEEGAQGARVGGRECRRPQESRDSSVPSASTRRERPLPVPRRDVEAGQGPPLLQARVLQPSAPRDPGARGRRPVPTAPRHSATDPAVRHPGGHRLSGSLSRPDRTVVARLSPVSRRADAARRRPGRHRASPRDSGFVMTAHRSTSTRAYFTAASTRVRRRVRVASTPPARAALPHPTVGSAHPPLVPRRATTPAHGLPPTIESP